MRCKPEVRTSGALYASARLPDGYLAPGAMAAKAASEIVLLQSVITFLRLPTDVSAGMMISCTIKLCYMNRMVYQSSRIKLRRLQRRLISDRSFAGRSSFQLANITSAMQLDISLLPLPQG